MGLQAGCQCGVFNSMELLDKKVKVHAGGSQWLQMTSA